MDRRTRIERRNDGLDAPSTVAVDIDLSARARRREMLWTGQEARVGCRRPRLTGLIYAQEVRVAFLVAGCEGGCLVLGGLLRDVSCEHSETSRRQTVV